MKYYDQRTGSLNNSYHLYHTCFYSPQTPLATYDIEIAAGLFVFLFIARRFSFFSRKTRLFESVIFTFVIVGIITTTGGMQSPYFFLIHFLLFALTLLLEAIIPIIVTIVLMLFFLFSFSGAITLQQLLPIFSLALMTPFALILGNEYEETKRLKKSLSNQQENTFLFLSLMLKNNLKEIQKNIDNFRGDHELTAIKRQVRTMDKMIDMFEKEN